jgi:hypothetical protein
MESFAILYGSGAVADGVGGRIVITQAAVDDVVEYLLDETVLADAPCLALARAERVERRQRRAS